MNLKNIRKMKTEDNHIIELKPLAQLSNVEIDEDDSNLDNYYRGTFAARLSIVGSIGGFIFGYDTGIISGA